MRERNIIIGKINGTDVEISSNSVNQHISIFGISGSGKSTRINEILKSLIAQEQTIIAFDLSGREYLGFESANRICAMRDGLNLKLLNSSVNTKEERANLVAYLVDVLGSGLNLGCRQMGALRTALSFAIEYRKRFQTEAEAIAEGLSSQNSSVADGVYNKLWELFEGGIWRESEKIMCRGCFNIIDLSGINPTTQKSLVEIFLASLWREIRTKGINRDITIVIDEFQNLTLNKKSVLMEMLQESRKYGVQIILSTQTLSRFSKDTLGSIQQTATQLYFKPNLGDIKKIADLIGKEERGKVSLMLSRLNVGESLAVGAFVVGGREIRKPIIVKSTMDEQMGLVKNKEDKGFSYLL